MLASFFYELFFCAQDIKWSLEKYWWAMGYPYSAVCSYSKGKPLFEMCWFYMSTAQIALDPPPSLSNGQT